MAQIAKSGTPSLATVTTQVNSLSGLIAGEAIDAGDAAAQVYGYACQAASVGEAVTLAYDVRFRYGASLTPGTKVYLSATAGTLSDAATTGGTAPIGVV